MFDFVSTHTVRCSTRVVCCNISWRVHPEAVRTVYLGFVLPARQHEVVRSRVAAVLTWIFVCITVRIRTRESSWCTRTNICICFPRWVFVWKLPEGLRPSGRAYVLFCLQVIIFWAIQQPFLFLRSTNRWSSSHFLFCDLLVRWSTCHKCRCDPLSRVIHSRTTPGIQQYSERVGTSADNVLLFNLRQPRDFKPTKGIESQRRGTL